MQAFEHKESLLNGNIGVCKFLPGSCSNWSLDPGCTVQKPCLSNMHHLDEFFVVDVALRVLHALDQLVNLIVAQLLTKGSKDVAELSAGDKAILLLVKDAESLNEILQRGHAAVLADGLQDWVERLKRDTRIWVLGVAALADLLLGGVLVQRPQHIAKLACRDLVVSPCVKQTKRLLDLVQIVFRVF